MNQILSLLSNIAYGRFLDVIIEEPRNSSSELEEIQSKYMEKLMKVQYVIVSKNYQHPKFGHCTRTYISNINYAQIKLMI